MQIKRKRESRDQRRYTRSSTNKGFILRRPAHLGRILMILLLVMITIAVALIWGSHLKEESDAYRASLENGEWTLNPEIATPLPVTVPDIRAISIKPEGNVGDILIAGGHDGVIMTLNDFDGMLCYTSTVGEKAGLAIQEGAVPLSQDVARVQKRGLNVTCVFTVSCFSGSDDATQTYLRGLELALLQEYAEAGMNDLLLFGLPAGDDRADQLTVMFLKELRNLLSDLPNPPAIGVALPAAQFRTDDSYTQIENPEEDVEAGIPVGSTPLYAGNITPARILGSCDYLAMDLRDQSAEEIASILPHIRYTYVRHSLRLLVNKQEPAVIENMQSHGFVRIFEMDIPAYKQSETAP